MVEHTKAPWKVKKSKEPDNTGGYDYAIIDSQEKIIAETFEHVGKTKNGYEKRPAEANAKLISAAPELLEALKNVIKFWESGCFIDAEIEQAKQAIKKAEG
jgi:hypothetical protein